MNKDLEQIEELLLIDPFDGSKLEIVSPPKLNKDKSYSFVVENLARGARWKHTIKTCEV